MPVIDLSHPLTTNMPVYPGTPPPVIQLAARIEEDGFRERRLTFSSHNGTHMDAPSHLLTAGKTLDQFTVDRFVGRGLCIDVGRAMDGIIGWRVFQPHESDLIKSDFVLLRTGWGRYWGTPRYDQGYPALSPEAARRLSEFNLKGIGVDAFSVDSSDATDYPVHRIILTKEILIIENLANLEHLPEGWCGQLYCLPLHLTEADGAPVRVVAIR